MKLLNPAALALASLCLVAALAPAASGGPPVTAASFDGSYSGTGSATTTTDCPATAGSKAFHSSKSAPMTHAAVTHGTIFGKPIVVSGNRGSVRFSKSVNFITVTFSATLVLGAGGVPVLTLTENGSGTTHGCTVRLRAEFTGRRV